MKITEVGNDLQRLKMFWCPGCNTHHGVDKRWTITGTEERPTISPSVLCDYGNGKRCHLFVKDGQIQYLDDCTHELKGKIIEMEDTDIE